MKSIKTYLRQRLEARPPTWKGKDKRIGVVGLRTQNWKKNRTGKLNGKNQLVRQNRLPLPLGMGPWGEGFSLE